MLYVIFLLKFKTKMKNKV